MLVFVTPRHQDKTGIAYARVTHSCMHALCFFSMHSYLYTHLRACFGKSFALARVLLWQEFCFGKSFITASILHALIRTPKCVTSKTCSEHFLSNHFLYHISRCGGTRPRYSRCGIRDKFFVPAHHRGLRSPHWANRSRRQEGHRAHFLHCE